jgi:plasmid stabilization system protein ParE
MRVRLSLRAFLQLQQILRYTAQESPAGAASISARTTELLALLAENPNFGRKIPRRKQRRLVLREHPYLIYYEVESGEIVITRIRHAARRRAAFHEPTGDFRV